MNEQPRTQKPVRNHCLEHATNDVETLFKDEAGEGWQLEYLQLTPGRLGAWYRILYLPDMTIDWYRCKAMLRVQEFHRQERIYLSFLLSADGQFKWRGRELSPSQVLLYHPGIDHDYVLPKNIRFMGLSLSKKLIRQMGWDIRFTSILDAKTGVLRSLAKRAEAITNALLQAPLADEERLQILQEKLLKHLEELFAPDRAALSEDIRLSLQADRLYSLAYAACQEMLEMDLSRKLDVTELANRVYTSTRSLYRAFQHCYGVGPYEYYTLLRFQAFRKLMFASNDRHSIITDTAMKTGFTHLGRFSSLYRKQYGELPKDTLRRWLAA